MEASFYTKFFLVALFIKSLIESFLDKRNMDHIIKHRNAVPQKFSDQITLADHQKAADYSVEKIKASQVFHLVDLVIFLALTLFGGLELINHYAMGFNATPIVTGLIFFAFFGIFDLSVRFALFFLRGRISQWNQRGANQPFVNVGQD